MAELKTQRNDASVDAYISAIEDESRREDCRQLAQMMQRITGEEPHLWGTDIVGFGTYRYAYASGRQGDWFVIGFASRKRDLTLYLAQGFGSYDELLGKLGKHRTGKSCLYVKHLADLDMAVLEQLLTESVAFTRNSAV